MLIIMKISSTISQPATTPFLPSMRSFFQPSTSTPCPRARTALLMPSEFQNGTIIEVFVSHPDVNKLTMFL
jgi:hypothetical protein